ncbi:pyridoxamine kinase [Pyramidobacter piscolens]|uniref:pyridoxamine kinase n=1 Tax=Pyramidobacter piscolens TaxID=638849 RepID=UPI001FCC4329|nr:pyridoxamine kinase [Pyramidobacter piscolens]BDF77784.1 pyridoxal kinase [Pyramidobacter piscolens]
MSYKRILTVQDISCVGQCSLTVALPILSACGLETAILPSAVLSTHTGGFTGYTFHDLTAEMPRIIEHWEREQIRFDAVYSGYLGNASQTEYLKEIYGTLLQPGGLRIADPAMADNGRLYPGFDAAYVEAMRRFVFAADLILPNITEAALLTGVEYRERYDESYVDALLAALRKAGAKTVVLTGVSYDDATTGVVVDDGAQKRYYRHEKLPKGCHGTGDVFASVFAGMLTGGKSAYDAAVAAADFTLHCIRFTAQDPSHWYGVKFEPLLRELTEQCK